MIKQQLDLVEARIAEMAQTPGASEIAKPFEERIKRIAASQFCSMADFLPEYINPFKSLFHARRGIFVTRWELPDKCGYMPAYRYDPYHYRVHKMKGGTFQNYPDKSFLPLTDDQIIKHLNGEHFIGIYPLLQDNTSRFIAADFDEGNWANAARQFIRQCEENSLPVYLERSRSGNGGHVWIFFDKPVPAYRSRKVILAMLISSGAPYVPEKKCLLQKTGKATYFI